VTSAASEISDELVLAAVAGGDVAALAVLVRRYQRAVYGLALSVLGDTGGAEDAAQEAFVRVWRYAGSFDARRGRVAPWLLGITRNVALDARRIRKATVLVEPAELARWSVAGASEDGPEQAAERAADAARLRDGLRGLPEALRRPLILASWYGATAAEISVAEGIPLGTAKTRVRTALRRLRSELSNEEVPR